MSDHDMDLLFSAASASIKAAKITTRAVPAKPSLLDHTQWTRSRGIALVHAESETLLGNFSEWLHPSGARRLQRENQPIRIDATESVSGSWWIEEAKRPEARQDWHDKRPCIMHLHLELMGLHAPAVELVVHTSYGGIARCELSMKTLFTNTVGTQTLVELPAGTNVLEVMSLDAKINLRREVGL